jgi:hypothetical protein
MSALQAQSPEFKPHSHHLPIKKNMWCIYTMEYHSPKQNEMFEGKWMKLKIIRLSEIKQTERCSVIYEI